MKKILIPILALVLALGIAGPVMAKANAGPLSSPEFQDPPTPQTLPATVTLWAGQHIDAGNVTVSKVDDSLQVKYQTTGGWVLTETHLYLGTEPPEKSAPGRFPYSHEDLGGATSDSYSVALSDLDLGEGECTLYVAAHAKVAKVEAGDIAEETGWGKGVPIRPGKNWAMYFAVDVCGGGGF